MKVKEHAEWTELLSDFLDGTLDSDRHEAVEDHLTTCGACRTVLAELRGVVAGARTLEPRSPSRDLWPGIAAAIGAPVAAASRSGDVIALPGARASTSAGTSALVFTAPQLATAATLLVAVSVAITSWVGPGIGARDTTDVARPSTAFVQASQLPAAPAGLTAELADLEAELRRAADSLDPETVRILESNLAVIERAIVDSRLALAQDPGNEFLTEHLERVYQRKLTYLREAVRVSEWAG